MLDKSFLDKHDTDPDEEDNDASSPNPLQSTRIRIQPIDPPSSSSLPSHPSPGYCDSDYLAESRSPIDHDDSDRRSAPNNEDDPQSTTSYLSDPCPVYRKHSHSPSHLQFTSYHQYHQHLTSQFEQASLPSPHSVDDSYSSIDESHLNQRIKILVKNNKKSKIKKKLSHGYGGIKSRPIKYLKHPLDRSIASFFLLTLFFTLLALITGLPVVLTLSCFLIPAMLILKCLNCCSKGNPATMIETTPIESYWLIPQSIASRTKCSSNDDDNQNNNNPNSLGSNNNLGPRTKINSISTCLLFIDRELNIDQLRDVFMARVVQKPEMARFRSVLCYKGLTRTPVWSRLSFEEFNIEKQIINDCVLTSRSELKDHLTKVMSCSLPHSLPPWQIRRCCASYLNQVILILRTHQSVIDGIGMAKLLVQYLADQAPPKTTTFIRTTQGTTATTGHFKPRFGGINFTINLVRAAIVGPLTFSLWIIWAFTKRKANYLKKKDSSKVITKSSCSHSKYLDQAIMINTNNNNNNNIADNTINNVNSDNNNNPSNTVSNNVTSSFGPTAYNIGSNVDSHNSHSHKSVHWTTIEMAKIQRVKQVTRSCLNDVILAAVTGSVRRYMVARNITNPPDIGISLPVDIRGINDAESDIVRVNYVVLTLPLPTSIEGAIPRLWEIRHNMEELKTSADPAVMYGAHYYLNSLLPGRLYRFILNLIHRNSSICLSNLQGPGTEVSIGSHRLRKILFWMSPPPSVSITFNTISYGDKLFVSVSSSSKLLPCARALAKAFKGQIRQLSELLSKRRVPGEGRPKKRSPNYVIETPFTGTGPYLTSDLTAKLNAIQYERYQMNELLETNPMNREDIEYRLEELKDEFADLMKQLRRRKSIAEYAMHNIVINVEDNLGEDGDDDDDLDGELRPPIRRFSFNVASRRSSVASAISMPSSRFQVSPPHISRRYISSSPEPSSPSESYIKEETV
ncbi:uncharacterized protein LOC107368589 [Tetranychus urticae]|uniref:O-acyltransferase WSD1 C-terminal domain-containing protein n=1 Tax=Tetranychus urticae TaxID=32264 RepID=T1KYX0_TETUR|nr:uncharacterized protein LOC107368589 [Tetranychus urticae]